MAASHDHFTSSRRALDYRMAPHEALFCQALPDGRVLCTLCPPDCRIPDGARGACSVRCAHGGRLYQEVNPIEKKPLFHFLPGSHGRLQHALCLLPELAHPPVAQDAPPEAPGDAGRPRVLLSTCGWDRRPRCGRGVTPESIVAAAMASGCASLSHTFTEPTIFFELACETAVLAPETGMKNNFVSNGYISGAPLRQKIVPGDQPQR